MTYSIFFAFLTVGLTLILTAWNFAFLRFVFPAQRVLFNACFYVGLSLTIGTKIFALLSFLCLIVERYL